MGIARTSYPNSGLLLDTETSMRPSPSCIIYIGTASGGIGTATTLLTRFGLAERVSRVGVTNCTIGAVPKHPPLPNRVEKAVEKFPEVPAIPASTAWRR